MWCFCQIKTRSRESCNKSFSGGHGQRFGFFTDRYRLAGEGKWSFRACRALLDAFMGKKKSIPEGREGQPERNTARGTRQESYQSRLWVYRTRSGSCLSDIDCGTRQGCGGWLSSITFSMPFKKRVTSSYAVRACRSCSSRLVD